MKIWNIVLVYIFHQEVTSVIVKLHSQEDSNPYLQIWADFCFFRKQILQIKRKHEMQSIFMKFEGRRSVSLNYEREKIHSNLTIQNYIGDEKLSFPSLNVDEIKLSHIKKNHSEFKIIWALEKHFEVVPSDVAVETGQDCCISSNTSYVKTCSLLTTGDP